MTRIGMVCEAPSDQRTATILASRALGRTVETVCIDAAVDRNPTFSCWTKLDRHPREWPRYHLNGRWGSDGPVHGQTLATRKALLLFDGKADAVILMLDGDDEGDARRAAMERARTESTTIPPDRIVIAVPRPERESWHIAGFEPTDGEESTRLGQVRTELGADPRLCTHTLKHGKDQAKRNAKRVLAVLTGDDHDRQWSCVEETPVEVLRERGQQNGLADFLNDVRRLPP